MFRVGLADPRGLFQPKWFDFMCQALWRLSLYPRPSQAEELTCAFDGLLVTDRILLLLGGGGWMDQEEEEWDRA